MSLLTMSTLWSILCLVGVMFLAGALLLCVIYFGWLKKRANQARDSDSEKQSG